MILALRKPNAYFQYGTVSPWVCSIIRVKLMGKSSYWASFSASSSGYGKTVIARLPMRSACAVCAWPPVWSQFVIIGITSGSWDYGSVSLWQRASHELRVSSSQSNMR